ncbi:MAG: hypothetical protein HYW25_06085 [Candidatus Aenigmarchaeota archaeon]|nr:hypothetical protein [Candidatus Aenigmarchaeota archaeon]
MKPGKTTAGRAAGADERLSRIANATQKHAGFEDAAASMKDIILRLREENDSLKLKAARNSLEPFMPNATSALPAEVFITGTGKETEKNMMNTSRELLQTMNIKPTQTNHPAKERHHEEPRMSIENAQKRAIKLMRKKFGLPPKVRKKGKSMKRQNRLS